ncbi:MAG: hypothetical protein ACK4JE_03525 [Endomicrobiia bacterium]
MKFSLRKILAFIFILVVGIIWWFYFYFVEIKKEGIFIYPEKKEFFRYEFVKIFAEVKGYKNLIDKKTNTLPLKIFVTYKNQPVQTIGKKKIFKFKYDKKIKKWFINFPCPWNPPLGKYKIIPVLDENIRDKKIPIIVESFIIKSRHLPKMPSGFGVLTLEGISPFKSLRVKAPGGETKGWQGLIDWAEFIGADAFWCLGGSTSYHNKKLSEEFPFIDYNFDIFSEVAKECHKRGLKFGVYTLAYMTFGEQILRPNYKYAWTYENGELKETRAISLADEKRFNDLIKFYKRLNQIPEIDFYGIDYIRNALGGYELVDDFVKEMEVEVPPNWQNFSKEERMTWLAKKKIARKDKVLIDQWQWWRAHKCSHIIKRIKESAEIKKPFWAFTLSWEKGWQHGQDPVMFADAGVDINPVMMYECNREQFDTLIGEWNSYLKKGQSNLMIGDVVDWPLHQYTTDPPGPKEFYDRKIISVKKMFNDGFVEGVFVHDIGRALWGRLGPYTIYEWLLAGASAISKMRELTGTVSIYLSDFNIKRKNGKILFEGNIQNKKNLPQKIDIKFYNSSGKVVEEIENFEINVSSKTLNVSLSWENFDKGFIACSVEWKEETRQKKFICFEYLK